MKTVLDQGSNLEGVKFKFKIKLMLEFKDATVLNDISKINIETNILIPHSPLLPYNPDKVQQPTIRIQQIQFSNQHSNSTFTSTILSNDFRT